MHFAFALTTTHRKIGYVNDKTFCTWNAFTESIIVAVVIVSVGTLKDGYVRNVPLPRVPQIQSASPTMSHERIAPKVGIALPGYLPVTSWIPTLPKIGSILRFSQRVL